VATPIGDFAFYRITLVTCLKTKMQTLSVTRVITGKGDNVFTASVCLSVCLSVSQYLSARILKTL